MESRSKRQSELLWARVVMRKWLNISSKDSDYSADPDDPDSESEDDEAYDKCERNFRTAQGDINDDLPKIRRRTSETFRAQYINTKELRIRVGTWNVGGEVPPDELDIDDWININDPADIYVLGIQEIVPLNAGNIFGAEDKRPVAKWENIIRDTLNRIRPSTMKVKSFSDPPSPSKFKPSEDIPDIEEEVFLESGSDIGEEIYPLDDGSISYGEVKAGPVNDKSNFKSSELDCIESEKLFMPVEQDLQRQFSSPKKLDRLNCLQTEDSIDNIEREKIFMPAEQDLQRQFSSPKKLDRLNCLQTEDSIDNLEVPVAQNIGKLTKMLSNSEKIGLSWPEPPRDLLSQHVLERTNTFKSVKSFKASKTFKTYRSFKSFTNEVSPGIALLAELDLESLISRKRSSYVRMVSKQMVGIFLTVWVRRSLRRHIQNLSVSTVGVGVMGYIGNKGSVSVSMSIYQTLFCFVCTHLTAGEKDGDELKRNADVHEIKRRTQFRPVSNIGPPRSIHDHERIIWLGDLNYRINLSYAKARELISKKEWSKLMERDQLVRELRKGCAFDGWAEGTLTFPPTYKYEVNSEKYYGDDPKAGRRTPAWCDRILSYGKGMKLLSYRRTELKLSDHRPVSATYMAEVEVLSPRKLQRALTFTDAEIENTELVADFGY